LFFAPIIGARGTMSAQAAVDLAHLARYTGGDRSLNAEVLRLFVNQAAELIGQLQSVIEARDAKTWRHITHSMKGAARGIGAFELADVAADAEPLDLAQQNREALEALTALKTRAEAVHRFVDAYLGA
jgi:HPt (histidine-containing phosphotransfer) domain-containing protein